MTAKRLRLITILAAFTLVAVACGQKPGVHRGIASGERAGFEDEFFEEDLEGDVRVIEGEEGEAGRRVGGPGGTGGQPGQQQGAGAGGRAGGPADRTGVTDDSVTVGIHAPVTGAAPFPARAFERGREVYWRWSGAPNVHGRTVRVIFEDDNYDPRTARDRCRKMAEQDGAFLLIGGGGTDQIVSCAQYAAQAGIPYLSAGVAEAPLRPLPTYFAVSMSYAQQAPLLWQMIKADQRLNPHLENVAMVWTNTPNFQDARNAFVEAMDGDGQRLRFERRMSKNPSATEYDTTARDLRQSGSQVVFILTAPVHYVQLTAAHRIPAYRPWWVGVGITKGLNDVLDTGCDTSQNAIDQGLFFSPFPGLDRVDQMDPSYNRAYRDVNDQEGDDLGLAFWGLHKTLHQLLENAGRDLTRGGFIRATQGASVETNVFPPLRYAPDNHFGADSVHVLKANCSTKRHDTAQTFASSF